MSFAHPLEAEGEVKTWLEHYKKEYYDARHVCYAFVFGEGNGTMKSSDAGEPNGTAGLPILNQLRSFEVRNVLLVVVRYFGGTKLGAAGLVHAYKSAARTALENAQLVEKPITIVLEISFSYEKMNRVMRSLKETKAELLEQNFSGNVCTIKFRVMKSQEKVLQEKLKE